MLDNTISDIEETKEETKETKETKPSGRPAMAEKKHTMLRNLAHHISAMKVKDSPEKRSVVKRTDSPLFSMNSQDSDFDPDESWN